MNLQELIKEYNQENIINTVVDNSTIELKEEITQDNIQGRKFVSRFIEAGVVNYADLGNVLIKKETIDKFIDSMVGCPVVIGHKDLNAKNIENERVGSIANVWFNPGDGWFYCDGIITDKKAIDLVKNQGWSVSCTYEFTSDFTPRKYNDIDIDMEFIDGEFLYLAIVDNPRYSGANIVINSKDFKEDEHPRDEQGKFAEKGTQINDINPNYQQELKQVIDKAKNNPNERQKLIIGTVTKELEEKARKNGFDISGYQHDLDVSGTRHAIKEHSNPKTEDLRGQIAITDDDFKKIPDVIYSYDDVSFGETDTKNTPLIKYSKKFDDGPIIYVEEIRTRQKTLTIKSMWKHKNNADNSCTFTDFNLQRPEYISNIIITNNQVDFNLDNTKVNNSTNRKENLIMTVLEDLKAYIKDIVNNECDKDKKADNEKVDKRDIIRQIMAIAGKHEDNEDVKTIAKLAEKLAYDESEAGTADNKKHMKNI